METPLYTHLTDRIAAQSNSRRRAAFSDTRLKTVAACNAMAGTQQNFCQGVRVDTFEKSISQRVVDIEECPDDLSCELFLQ